MMLFSAARDGVTLDWALRHAAPPGTSIGLFQTPRRYYVARVDDGRVSLRDGSIPLEEVFDARVFSDDVELRWLNVDDGHGRAVALTEDAAALPEQFEERHEPIRAVDVLRGEYLLWGRAAAHHDTGWTTLTSARVGALDVPATVPAGERAVLVTREYVARDPEHGNAYVAEERLLHLETAQPGDAS